jgi:alpha-tubulin suppressor-like RCC1 family protein
MRYAIIIPGRPWVRLLVGAVLLLGLMAPINCTPDSVVAPPPPPPGQCTATVLSLAIQPLPGTATVNGVAIGILGADAGFAMVPQFGSHPCGGGPPLPAPAWSVDDTTVIRPPEGLENTGNYRAIGTGQATITVDWGGQHATMTVVVPPVPVIGPLVAVSAGNFVTCAVNASSQVYCWGSDAGNLVSAAGTAATGLCAGAPCSPVPLFHLAPGPVDQLDARGQGVCVLKSGSPWCWVDAQPPAPLAGSLLFREIGKGFEHTCGLDAEGTAYCWGNNTFGQLGDSSRISRSAPVRVMGTQRYATIAAGLNASCALTVDGALYCWGEVAQGSSPAEVCAEGSKGISIPCWLLPTRVDLSAAGTDTVFRSLSVGSHSCAISTTGRAYCWGAGDPQLLGLNTVDARALRPGPVETDLLFQSISVGYDHTCALVPSGEAYCWGGSSASGPVLGQLGDGTTVSRTRPVAVAGGLRFRSISAGYEHTCAITLDGAGYCWGLNHQGQLGIGSQSASLVPARVLGQ